MRHFALPRFLALFFCCLVNCFYCFLNVSLLLYCFCFLFISSLFFFWFRNKTYQGFRFEDDIERNYHKLSSYKHQAWTKVVRNKFCFLITGSSCGSSSLWLAYSRGLVTMSTFRFYSHPRVETEYFTINDYKLYMYLEPK